MKKMIYIIKLEECYNNLYYSNVLGAYTDLENAKLDLDKLVKYCINEYMISMENAEIHDNKIIFDLGDDYFIYEIVERELI